MKPALKKNIHRWRAASLLAVYILIALHITHWLIKGRTLAPLEFNEVLYSIHLGIITAGLIFMAMAIIGTLIFGRFFCSWACHILALQDLSAWILEKMKIKPQPIKSRAFFIVPIAAMFYLFVWPQLVRIMEGQPMPEFRILKDEQGWASFSTTDFWRNLPGPGITAFTFIMVGFVIVYLLGTRSFCRYGCPYGVLFGWMDKLTPGKIILAGNCNQCGLCTAGCNSHIQVHKEIKEFGKVVDSACLKDLDCVAVCPNDALQWGFTKPSFGQSLSKNKDHEEKYSFTLTEDIALGVMCFALTVIFRGLYDAVPFLVSITLAVVIAYLFLVAFRSLRKEYVHLGKLAVRRSNRLTSFGKTFLAFSVVLLAFVFHSAFIHYHAWYGENLYNQVVVRGNTVQLSEKDVDAKLKLDLAEYHLARAHEWGIWQPESLERELASIYIFRKDYSKASVHLESMLMQNPDDHEARLRLAKIYILKGDDKSASEELRFITEQEPANKHDLKLRSDAHLQLGHLDEKNGFFTTALEHYKSSLSDMPENSEAALALGVIYTKAGQFKEGEKYLLRCDSLMPNNPLILNNLSVIYMRTGRQDIAIMCLGRITELQPDNPSASYNLGMLLLMKGDEQKAIHYLQRTLQIDPDHENSHIALGDVFEKNGNIEQSAYHRSKVTQPVHKN